MTDRDDEQTIKLLKHVKGAWVSHLLGGIFMSMRECVSPFFTPRLICRTVKINHLMQFMLNREYLFAPNKSMKAELLMNENGKWQMIIMRQLTNCFRLQNAQESLENISSLFIVWNQIECNIYVYVYSKQIHPYFTFGWLYLFEDHFSYLMMGAIFFFFLTKWLCANEYITEWNIQESEVEELVVNECLSTSKLHRSGKYSNSSKHLLLNI